MWHLFCQIGKSWFATDWKFCYKVIILVFLNDIQRIRWWFLVIPVKCLFTIWIITIIILQWIFRPEFLEIKQSRTVTTEWLAPNNVWRYTGIGLNIRRGIPVNVFIKNIMECSDVRTLKFLVWWGIITENEITKGTRMQVETKDWNLQGKLLKNKLNKVT
jgi:hypothetical protein